MRDGPGAAADSVPTEHTLTQCLQSIPSTFYLLYSPTESEVRRVCVCVMEDILIFPQLYADDVRLFFDDFEGFVSVGFGIFPPVLSCLCPCRKNQSLAPIDPIECEFFHQQGSIFSVSCV